MLDARQTLADIVLDHAECALVFQRHQIDFCCRGDRTVAQACADRGLRTDAVLQELATAVEERAGGSGPDPRSLSTPELVAHLVSRHHRYLRRTLPLVEGLADKVERAHGERNERFRELAAVLHELAAALTPHLDHEEQVLFPALMVRSPDRELVARELEQMRGEHEHVARLLERIREAADQFRVPDGACASTRTLLAELAELEADTWRHVHLENHLLGARVAGRPAGESRP